MDFMCSHQTPGVDLAKAKALGGSKVLRTTQIARGRHRYVIGPAGKAPSSLNLTNHHSGRPMS